jgi:hypothetical protein
MKLVLCKDMHRGRVCRVSGPVATDVPHNKRDGARTRAPRTGLHRGHSPNGRSTLCCAPRTIPRPRGKTRSLPVLRPALRGRHRSAVCMRFQPSHRSKLKEKKPAQPAYRLVISRLITCRAASEPSRTSTSYKVIWPSWDQM